MTVNHDAVAALPITSAPSQTLLRNVNVARMPYVLFDADDSRNIILTDPATGAKTIDLLLFGRVFHYDPTDTTTAHDGTSCLVSSDGLRYKLALGTDVFAYAVIDNAVSVPPVSPTLGDSYLVAVGATGAWAGKSNYVAVKTNRGWEFLNFGIGRFIYVESIDSYYHKNAAGAWSTGFGNQTSLPNSITLSSVINFGTRILVENQTTTSPPPSPVVGTAYIIGPAATGGWAGHDGQIAICEIAGSFVIYTPTNGWEAYDKAQSASFTFKGSAWTATAGAILAQKYTFDTVATISSNGSGGYAYSDTVAPAAWSGNTDLGVVNIAAPTGSKIEIQYQARFVFNLAGIFTIGLMRDSETTALDWMEFRANQVDERTFTFFVVTGDSLAHDYKIKIYSNTALTAAATVVSRRTLIARRWS